ncbi:MAG: 50S ribosomal protein L29 [Bacteroidales bacterium]|jgi:large subunit ribosomal protein L29|nr:50S ribosomal protein L29 [Bacteroidales bacterium]HQK36185.1 50S ribosomal protein L29 [Bacteroidales bacterium]
MKKKSFIKEMSDKELRERIDAEKDVLRKLILNHAISPLDNPLKIRSTRRDIARMLTELSMRQNKK